MDLNAKYRSKRDEYWPQIERYFDRLPPALFRQGQLFRVNMAAAHSSTGQFEDILCRAVDYPWLTLHFALLDDLEFSGGQQRICTEQHIFLSTFYSLAATFVQESILDQGSVFDSEYIALLHSLTQHADWHLAHLFPGESPFWTYHRAFWRDYAEAVLWEQTQHSRQGQAVVAKDSLLAVSKLAPAKISVAAAALKAARGIDLAQLLSFLDHLNTVFQVSYESRNVRHDLLRGRYTYPILRAMEEAGIAFEPSLRPERVLGALVLTGVMAKIYQECVEHLEACRRIAGTLGLPTFEAYCAHVQAVLHKTTSFFSLKPLASLSPVGVRSHGTMSQKRWVDTLPKTCAMAEGFLFSDLTFRESWEVQRQGLFGAPEVVSRNVSGFIIEVLCKHGHELSAQVNAFYRHLQAAEFCYYEHPHSVPDTDSLGMLLRLHRYSNHKEMHAKMLQKPLLLMEANILDSGWIPVWLTKQLADGRHEKPLTVEFGANCGVVEAHLLLGLVDYDWARYREIVSRAASILLDRFVRFGYGVTVNYPPLYMLWVMLCLVDELSARGISNSLRLRLERATEQIVRHLEHEVQRQRITPQGAAFLMLACAHPLTQSLYTPRWMTTLFKHQRCDGRWDGEPFFFVFSRGMGFTWYVSHTMTTAFCYHALKTRLERTNVHG
jgi:hypothetical protein